MEGRVGEGVRVSSVLALPLRRVPLARLPLPILAASLIASVRPRCLPVFRPPVRAGSRCVPLDRVEYDEDAHV